MKKNLFITAISVLAFCACTSDDIEAPITESQTEHVIPMILNVTRECFDDEVQTRGEYTQDWEDGDILYISFLNGNQWVKGYATYIKRIKQWSVQYSGELVKNENTPCKVYYFRDDTKTFNTDNYQAFSLYTAVYLDTLATYTNSTKLILNATLRPQTGRVRFKGKPGATLKVYGIESFSWFDHDTQSLYMHSTSVLGNITIKSDGYSPYIYASLSENGSNELRVYISPSQYYSRVVADPVLQQGKSGFLQIPEGTSVGGWEMCSQAFYMDNTIQIYGEKYKMINVEGDMFQMGGANTEDASPVHSVFVDDYKIGQTEVTQGLWEAVMGSDPTGWFGELYPVAEVRWEDCQEFIKKLNKLTGMKFRFPTEAEWEFAARGGSQSKGYVYSGSNNIDEVAWAGENSDDHIHEVAKKAPNELGIYDMTGNVSEWCQDWYCPRYYSYSPLENPTGPSIPYDASMLWHCEYCNKYHDQEKVCRGGSYEGEGNGEPHTTFGRAAHHWKWDRVCTVGLRLAQ